LGDSKSATRRAAPDPTERNVAEGGVSGELSARVDSSAKHKPAALGWNPGRVLAGPVSLS